MGEWTSMLRCFLKSELCIIQDEVEDFVALENIKGFVYGMKNSSGRTVSSFNGRAGRYSNTGRAVAKVLYIKNCDQRNFDSCKTVNENKNKRRARLYTYTYFVMSFYLFHIFFH